MSKFSREEEIGTGEIEVISPVGAPVPAGPFRPSLRRPDISFHHGDPDEDEEESTRAMLSGSFAPVHSRPSSSSVFAAQPAQPLPPRATPAQGPQPVPWIRSPTSESRIASPWSGRSLPGPAVLPGHGFPHGPSSSPIAFTDPTARHLAVSTSGARRRTPVSSLVWAATFVAMGAFLGTIFGVQLRDQKPPTRSAAPAVRPAEQSATTQPVPIAPKAPGATATPAAIVAAPATAVISVAPATLPAALAATPAAPIPAVATPKPPILAEAQKPPANSPPKAAPPRPGKPGLTAITAPRPTGKKGSSKEADAFAAAQLLAASKDETGNSL